MVVLRPYEKLNLTRVFVRGIQRHNLSADCLTQFGQLFDFELLGADNGAGKARYAHGSTR